MRYKSMKAALVTSAAVGRFSNRWRSQMSVCTNDTFNRPAHTLTFTGVAEERELTNSFG